MLNKKGFTLIEVLVVVLIIGILAALAAPNILGRIEQSRITSDKAMAKTLENAVASYLVDKDAANEPSTPPAPADFLSLIITEDYLDKATILWIKGDGTNPAGTKTQADATNNVFLINGKSKSIVIVYKYNDADNTFTVLAYDTNSGTDYARVP